MITPNRTRPRPTAVAAALLATGALAAGCASASTSSQAASPASRAPGASASGPTTTPVSGTASATTGSGSTGSGGTSSAPGVSGSAPAASETATPVPTVSGNPVPAGEVACAGWPSNAPTASLPSSFTPVTVERCLNSVQAIAGKGYWSTATLERADGGLSALVTALRQPSTGHKPGTMCPALAEIPQAVLLINAAGQRLIPKLPSTACGLTQSSVVGALNALHWTTVSVRLLSQLSQTAPPAPTVTGSARALQSGAAGS